MQGIFGFLIVALILGCVGWFVVSQIKQIIKIRKHKKESNNESNNDDKKGGVE